MVRVGCVKRETAVFPLTRALTCNYSLILDFEIALISKSSIDDISRGILQNQNKPINTTYSYKYF